MGNRLRPLTAAIALAFSGTLPALAQTVVLDDVVVTAERMDEPLKIVTDPKAPRQPIPAHDGADYLKTVPGFNVIRKGGTDGDPVLRGMAGSRLNILLDGEHILGGCGNRMDPPTAYVFPESFDRVTILKGPQTVLFGPGNSAGTVLFERDIRRFQQADWKFNGSLTLGSFGRNDQVIDARAGTPDFYAQINGTRSDSDDYKDGDGNRVHSRYTRWSTGAVLGWTPNDNTRLELSAIKSDGEAAYADRTMDGTKFSRENVGLKFETRKVSPLIEKIEAQVYYNYVDHVMDNYTLRTKPAGTMYMVSNPDRETTGARFAIGLRPLELLQITVGTDYQRNVHTLRSASGNSAPSVDGLARTEDANFRNAGLFGEATWHLSEASRLIGGLRGDSWRAQDQRATLRLGSGMGAVTVTNPTAGKTRTDTLTSGFARYEHDLAPGSTLYAGLGHSERFPDYWESISASKESLNTTSAFDTKPEKNNQVDIGWVRNSGPLSLSLSGFYSDIDDYILVQSGVSKTGPNRTVSIVRNVDAHTWGGELGAAYQLTANWKVDGSIAYVRGENETDGTPLAQLPPLEGRLGLTWNSGAWTVGSLLRLVAGQNRYDVNKGNIVGQDLGPTGGFGIFSMNASYKPTKAIRVSAGVDNLFDKTYAEHISRGGAAVSGYDQTFRVNEPGRTLWLKAQLSFD
ncbi:TonB-dependent copper receptor [Azonexus sp. IMCC34839]|uniref:TonB-dependent copper receptor n=1 Tax=Azonexus sp. IMCC34839 TaxID=3133695 RepID=UPI00399B0641